MWDMMEKTMGPTVWDTTENVVVLTVLGHKSGGMQQVKWWKHVSISACAAPHADLFSGCICMQQTWN